MMTDYIDIKAKEEGCSMIVLMLYRKFYCASFYYNQGYGPKGFHFVKIINEGLLSKSFYNGYIKK
jgi:hypothetical protein